MRMPFLKTAIAAAAVTIIAGCAVTQGDVNAVYNASHQTATDAMNAEPQPLPLVEDVDSAFLGDRQVPVAYDASLPAVFRERQVTIPANLGVKQIATLISNATGYSVHLSPDVFVPRESLVPRESTGDGKTNGVSGTVGRNNYEEPVFAQAYTGKVGAYLREMTDSLGLDWSFDGATINISRFVTRMYQIAAIPGKVSVKSTMSKGTQTSTGNQSNGGGTTSTDTGSFSAVTSTGRDGSFDQIQSITDELNRLRSPMGRVVVNPQSRLVVVYDTKEAADRMGELLSRENAISTRQVSIRVRTLQVQFSNGSQAGVNADVVFNAIQGGLAKYAVSFTSPTSLSSGGGTVGLSVLKPNAPFSGTNAVINALNQYGKTITDTTQTKLTLNGLPVSIASFQSDDFLRSTTPSIGSISGTSGGVPGLTPGTVTTGDFVNILPSVNDHNQIVLAYWADSSKLNGPFTTASAGSGETLQSIQLTHIIGNKDDQTIALSDGQTIVLYGTMTDMSDSTTNGGIAGITGTWNKSQVFQVIMLTASVVPSM
ncbi:type II secretory pathway protein [Paraburkholderia sp. SARCC-3016]|uniref:type II secretory pathway protein n=1 Tax=Paraburkholderia sp. SARCC-3016 TaxID=3058611 RepID=UPI002807F4B3|nr:type II secretory pathway protein [Paraburkholderia sp. SARCC-3016]MDQ7980373.1 type II secretory pathway protein [Paraburkholderia sp. SARCC-3016]